MGIEQLDLEPVQSANTNGEVAKVITQAQVWFENRKDQVNGLIHHLKKPDVTLDLNGTKIDDPDVIKGIRIGLLLANNEFFDTFPLSMKPNEQEHEEDDHNE